MCASGTEAKNFVRTKRLIGLESQLE